MYNHFGLRRHIMVPQWTDWNVIKVPITFLLIKGLMSSKAKRRWILDFNEERTLGSRLSALFWQQLETSFVNINDFKDLFIWAYQVLMKVQFFVLGLFWKNWLSEELLNQTWSIIGRYLQSVIPPPSTGSLSSSCRTSVASILSAPRTPKENRLVANSVALAEIIWLRNSSPEKEGKRNLIKSW